MIESYLPVVALSLVMAAVLLLPFSVKKIEEELEIFLLIMGVAAVTVSGQWSRHLLAESLREPLLISCAVLAAGFAFRGLRAGLHSAAALMIEKLGLPAAAFIIVLALGMCSSGVTAIIAALALSEAICAFGLDRDGEAAVAVYGCYAIGLGAALSPIGEPLSAITVAKLKGPPHFADSGWLFSTLGAWILPGVAVCAFMAARAARRCGVSGREHSSGRESSGGIILRALKIYVFVAALVLLGAGLGPLAEISTGKLAHWQLYWINSLSAVLDNATLAAAEIVPSMTRQQIQFLLMGLLVAGGMLIPGNIPNIICASKLGISSRRWAALALPPGIALMAVYFALLSLAR
ncbi:MAG: DUF1646 family protein [Elusimicrobiales bacterium]